MGKEQSIEISDWAIRNHQKGNLSDEMMANPERLTATFNLQKVYQHEKGHAVLVEFAGGQVNERKVIDATYGFTAFSLFERKLQRYLEKRAMICFGGITAETICGHGDHKGCYSDMKTAERLAQLPGFSYLRSYGESMASQVLSGYGRDYFEDESWVDMRRDGVI